MQCPECQSTHVNKNGQKKGKQNYICVGCGRQFIDCYQPHKGYSKKLNVNVSKCMSMVWVFEQLRGLKEYITPAL
jgi:transposase-like protein